MSTFPLNDVSHASSSSGLNLASPGSSQFQPIVTAEKVVLASFASSSQASGNDPIAHLLAQIEALQTPESFASHAQNVRSEIQAKRASLLSEYQKICGDCFEDTESQIHKSWMNFNLAESSFNASSSIPFDQTHPSDSGVETEVYKAFMPFLQLDLAAREIYQELIDLGSTYTSDPTLDAVLKSAREELIQSDAALCGSHELDLSAPLPRARKKYQDALSTSVDAAPLKKKLDLLEKQHAINVRNIYLFDQMLVAPFNPTTTVAAIAQRNIDKTILAIQSQITEEQTRSSFPDSSSLSAVVTLQSPQRSDLPSSDSVITPPSVTPKTESRVEGAFDRTIEQTQQEENGSGWGWPAVIIGTIVVVPLAAFGAYHYFKNKA
ncbi:MAG: hypothetical protein KF898_05615 [Parachlamydiales bacterium]|nr:hypothetical protein [Candidatus Acheromyda pituitae]